MKTYRVKIVDAFTKKPFAGNPAGVVLDANGLTDAQMQGLARELNLSETAFVLPPTEPDANQVFMPLQKREWKACAHMGSITFDYRQEAEFLLSGLRKIFTIPQ